MKDYKKIHCIGIGGIHVSALAKLLLSQGAEVSGSDLVKSKITEELQGTGADIIIGHDDAKLRKICETCENAKDILVIYSDAVPEDDLERMAAKKLGIPQMSSYEFIGELSKDYYTIAVSGTNGKSTTTAMLGLILEAAGMDPTVIVGTKVKEWKGNIRIGKSKPRTRTSSVRGKYLVTEADEYKAHMLKLNPKMIVLTNIEADHLDFYKDLDDIVKHFKEYVAGLPRDGVLIYNRDDVQITRLLDYSITKNVSFGVEDVSSLKLQVPGEFNKYNAAGAASAAKELGISNEIIKKSLENFKGTWRRFERVGECRGALVISDYAHHPTAVAGTIKATREFYPGRRLIAVFQPHQHNRTRKLFDDFVSVLAKSKADVIIVSEIYDVAGRTSDKDKKVSSKELAQETRNKKQEIKDDANVLYAKDLKETRSMILHYIKPEDVVLVMGAGDIDQVARKLVK
ncbi:UDP-N-acetylmuramate--L-alanine ligase [Patescibacteria group bacterium]|nr:UDP-N-acetylmuramate--L-alanine ligase [Patescibacteria group bacterium]MBU4511856.1 UDP-N-acetylmuramate--L-alanine ligase [Patescibacteria group bacterium]MCG2693251.1 UDP-N-acetylmuramate--L-alanine ligase [Candidatus Parcubacteria bacterium]